MKSRLLILVLLMTSVAAGAQTISEVFFPQYIQGTGTFTPSADRKVPFAARMTVSGLTPNATYRYYNRFVTNPASTTLGDGNYILVKDTGSFVRVIAASLAAAGRYGEFTTDSSGSYTGWFVAEPSSATIFRPGNSIYFRLILNDGAGGGAVVHRLTAANPVKVINFSTAADSTGGTALRSTPLKNGSAKQFIFLYDNILGPVANKRPIAGTFIESDGTDNTVANGYAAFYADSVNGINKAWGTILPNQLPNGILHIIQWPLHITNGLPERLYLSFDGKWPSLNRGRIDTKNPAGGLDNVLVIDGSRLSLINFWLNGEATNDETITLEWSTPEEPNARMYTIEKSVDGGKTFAPLSQINATGKTPKYGLTDSRSELATFYRVSLVGKDGSKVYSDVLAVEGVMKINVYPNPVINRLVMQHPQAPAGSTAQIVSIDGRQLLTQTIKEGAVQTTIDVTKLIPGNYMVLMNMNGQRQSKSFIKK